MESRRFRILDSEVVSKSDYLLAILSGVLLALSFPTPGLSLLAWFALVPLLIVIGKKSPNNAFRLGFTSGVAAYGCIFYWLNIVMIQYGKLPWFLSFPVFLLMVAYLALYVALLAWLVRKGEERGLPLLLTFPVFWVSLEYVRSWLLTGFPWADLGHTLYRTLPLIQVADVTGVYGLSALIAFANAVICLIIRGLTGRERIFPTRGALLLLGLLAGTLVYGFYRLNEPRGTDTLKIALVQGNIDQSIKWDPSFQEATVSIYERLSREACSSGADLVVWPESAVPFYFQSGGDDASRIRGLAGELKSCMVFGSPAYDMAEGKVKYLNSAFLLSPAGTLLGRSDKVHLVPFGEYVPLGKLLFFVNKMVEGIGEFSPGEKIAPLDTGKGKIGVLVCFEGIFPEIARKYVQAGSRMLVNITNDAWFGRSSAPYQHLSITVFRAVENRVPLVRAANTGITSIIDSKGHIQGSTPLFREAILTGEVPLGSGGSIYNRYGDLFAILCLAVSVIIAGLSFRQRNVSNQQS